MTNSTGGCTQWEYWVWTRPLMWLLLIYFILPLPYAHCKNTNRILKKQTYVSKGGRSSLILRSIKGGAHIVDTTLRNNIQIKVWRNPEVQMVEVWGGMLAWLSAHNIRIHGLACAFAVFGNPCAYEKLTRCNFCMQYALFRKQSLYTQ
jgi:hypothetical protein